MDRELTITKNFPFWNLLESATKHPEMYNRNPHRFIIISCIYKYQLENQDKVACNSIKSQFFRILGPEPKSWASKKSSPRLSTNNALFTFFSVICVMRIMSDTRSDTSINALVSIGIRQSGSTCAQTMERTRTSPSTTCSKFWKSVPANLTAWYMKCF